MTGPSLRTRAAVIGRCLGLCERCGKNLNGQPYSIHHRRPRGMGGTVRPETNYPSNLLVICGSPTTPGSCHQWIESRRSEACEDGLLLKQTDDPAQIPVLLERGWVLLTDDCGFEDVA